MKAVIMTATAMLLLAACGPKSAGEATADNLHNAADQSDPAAAQVLDNAAAEGGNDPLQQAAGCYGLYAPAAAAKPAGEWNSARIVVDGNHVEHWLNGQKVVEYEIASADWKQRVAKSKFAAWPEYGTIASGHVDLQDHGSAVTYRNLMIKVLPD